MPHVNPDTLSLEQKLLRLAAPWHFDDAAMNNHIARGDGNAVYERAKELKDSLQVSLADRNKSDYLVERMVAWRQSADVQRATRRDADAERETFSGSLNRSMLRG